MCVQGRGVVFRGRGGGALVEGSRLGRAGPREQGAVSLPCAPSLIRSALQLPQPAARSPQPAARTGLAARP